MRTRHVHGAVSAAATLLLAGCAMLSPSDPAAVATTRTGVTKPVIVQPSSPAPGSVIFVKWRVPEPMDHNGDGYRVTFRGPGGPACSETVTYGGGTTWNVRYNRRYEHRRAGLGFPPRRSIEPPLGVTDTWCIGAYRGRVTFIDYPAGKKHGKHHTSRSCTQRQVTSGDCEPTTRLVGRFSFSVR